MPDASPVSGLIRTSLNTPSCDDAALDPHPPAKNEIARLKTTNVRLMVQLWKATAPSATRAILA